MDTDFWIPDVIHGLSLKISRYFGIFLYDTCKSKSELFVSEKTLKDLSMSFLSRSMPDPNHVKVVENKVFSVKFKPVFFMYVIL